jgi:hypothetical protein
MLRVNKCSVYFFKVFFGTIEWTWRTGAVSTAATFGGLPRFLMTTAPSSSSSALRLRATQVSSAFSFFIFSIVAE